MKNSIKDRLIRSLEKNIAYLEENESYRKDAVYLQGQIDEYQAMYSDAKAEAIQLGRYVTQYQQEIARLNGLLNDRKEEATIKELLAFEQEQRVHTLELE